MSLQPLPRMLAAVDQSTDKRLFLSDDVQTPGERRQYQHLIDAGFLVNNGFGTEALCRRCGDQCMVAVEPIILRQGDAPARYTGACEDRDDMGTLYFDRTQLEQWITSPDIVATAMHRLLNTRSAPRAMAGTGGRLWHLGYLDGFARPIELYLAFGVEKADAGTLFRPLPLTSVSDRPVVLVLGDRPSSNPFGPEARIITCEEILQLTDAELLVDDSLFGMVADARRSPVTQPPVPLPIPRDFTWGHLIIEFISVDTVRVFLGGKEMIDCTYTTLGFGQARATKPRKIWYFLVEWAKYGGQFHGKNRSRLYPTAGKIIGPMSDLKDQLLTTFPGLTGEPYRKYTDEIGYQTTFTLRFAEGAERNIEEAYPGLLA
ncbi:MAG: hypothetical protein ACYDBB_01320 [Armatimonadota bacterium]